MKTNNNKKFRRSCFTLIEVVIVIVILVTLASIATPMYLNYVKSANIGAAKSQIKLLVDAVNGYKLAYKNYPEGENGLQALVENIEDWAASFLCLRCFRPAPGGRFRLRESFCRQVCSR